MAIIGSVELAGLLTTAGTVMEGGGDHDQAMARAEEAQRRVRVARERRELALREQREWEAQTSAGEDQPATTP